MEKISSLLLLLLTILPLTFCHFNFYMGEKEVKKLLGLEKSELYYVRDGVVNSYAINFEVLVPANVTTMEFIWQSLTRYPLPYSWSIEYNNRLAMRRPTFNVSLHGQLPNKPTAFNVKLECTGEISAEVRILLHLNVSAISHRENSTELIVRRNKVCIKKVETTTTTALQNKEISEIQKNIDGNRKNNKNSTDRNHTILADSVPDDEYDVNKRTNGTSDGRVTAADRPPPMDVAGGEREDQRTTDFVFYLLLGCCCGLIAIVLIFIFNSSTLHNYIGLKKLRLSRSSNETSYTSTPYAANSSLLVRLQSNGSTGSYATITSLHKYHPNFITPYATSYVAGNNTTTTLNSTILHSEYEQDDEDDEDHIYCKPETSSKISYYASSHLLGLNPINTNLKDPRLHNIAERMSLLYVPRNLIIMHRPIMEGAFGKIYKGFIRHPMSMDRLQTVIVKTVIPEASDNQISSMLAEGLMMYELKHVNILSIFATNYEPTLPPLLVYLFPTKGNLKRYLQNCRAGECGRFTLVTQDIINIAIQVAIAGVFLHTNGYYHRDLATRNCVIAEDFRIKVADSALSRDIFPMDYHCLGDNDNRPIKWLALESIVHRQYSAASDVWSFGVLLWELITLAQQPYDEIDPYEMHVYLKEGYRLSQPSNCPDDFFGMMSCCWLLNPDERPTFVQLLACLQDFQTALNRFV